MNDGLLVTFGILTVAIFFVFLRLTKRDTPTYVLMTLFYSGMLSVACSWPSCSRISKHHNQSGVKHE
jgi:hypothetical protein